MVMAATLVMFSGEPVTPEALGRTAGGHDLHENGGLGEITSVYQQPQQNKTCVMHARDALSARLARRPPWTSAALDDLSRSPKCGPAQ